MSPERSTETCHQANSLADEQIHQHSLELHSFTLSFDLFQLQEQLLFLVTTL